MDGLRARYKQADIDAIADWWVQGKSAQALRNLDVMDWQKKYNLDIMDGLKKYNLALCDALKKREALL